MSFRLTLNLIDNNNFYGKINMSTSRILAITFALTSALFFTGCANVKLDATGPTADTVGKLKAANITSASTGRFELAPGKDADMDTSLSGLRGSSIVPAKGSFSKLLQDTLVVELTAAGLYDEKSQRVIEGKLTDSMVDAAIVTGKARLAAIFTVTDSGKQTFEKELAVDATWDSSFIGGIAIPAAIQQYSALYKALVAKLVDDADFKKAMAR